MLPQSYIFSHRLCLNHFLQVWLIGDKRDQVTLFRYINHADEVSHLVRVRKVRGDMKDLLRSVKQEVEAVGICTEENWDVKRENSLYNMLSGRFNFKSKKRFDSLSCLLVVRYLYTRRGYIIGEINEKQEQAWQSQKKNR